MKLNKEISDKRKRQLQKLIDKSKEIVNKAFETTGQDKIGITWTGGKDSTLTLEVIRQVCIEKGLDIPKTMIIGEGDEFEEIENFVGEMSKKWNVPLKWCRNDDVLNAANHTLGAEIAVADLNAVNKKEIERIGFEDENFPFEPESYVGNHLMKTVVFNNWMKENKIETVFQGLRWDEHDSRYNDEYFESKTGDEYCPGHTRVRPILHFTEKDLWDTFALLKLPYCILYESGYRSLGAKSTSGKNSDEPAWKQDLENTEERVGRHQEKEVIMDQLRSLGYM